MSVSKKRKRPIHVEGVDYLWWVKEDEENPFCPSLHVVSEDGAVFAKLPLLQPAQTAYAVVLGSTFRGRPRMQGRHQRFRYPVVIAEGEPVTPKDAEALIRWATKDEAWPEEVNYLGLSS